MLARSSSTEASIDARAADPAPPTLVVRVLQRDGTSRDVVHDSSPFRAMVFLEPMRSAVGMAWVGNVHVQHVGDGPIDAGVSVAARLAQATGRWLIPGLFYGENRPAACRRLYPRLVTDGGDPDRFEADTWSFRADRAATPVVFGWDRDRTVALGTTENGALGLSGLGLSAFGGREEIRLFFPYREEPVAYDGSETPAPADRQFHRWQPGELVRLSFTVHLAPAGSHGYAPVLRDLHERLAPDAPLRPWVTIAEAAGLAADGLRRWHYRASDRVLLETASFERDGAAPGDAPGDRTAMHVAWVSGAPHAYALLAHGLHGGGESFVRTGEAVLDTIAANLAPCGTFWGQWTREHGWGKGWTPGEDRLHARTLAEATLFMARAVALEAAAGVSRAPWREAVASNLDFVARRQGDDGALGSSYHGRTGAVESWDGAAGMAWIPALIEGAQLLDRPELVDVARRAGTCYATFVDDEFVNGAPEDVDLAPTSEDGYVAVMAYVALVEAASDLAERRRWLDLARRAADWMLTFRYSYNVAFPETTLLGTYDYRTRGADQASVANQHLHAYGLICLPEMVRLAAYTGDRHYLDRTRENLACFRQFIARDDGDFNARRGMAPERYYQTACFGPKGGIGALSHAWCLGLLLYACEEALHMPELAEALA